MALYAVYDDDLIYAGEAESGKIYWCLDCFAPVKRRRGKRLLPHFYHINASPQCRLYSKTEDHLLAQLQIQKMFPPDTVQIERPFIQINRVADICWEAEKIIFEVQCSPMSEKEAEMRMSDYRSIGYETIWLLDDKRYNKRILRPAEEWLRRHSTYYISIKRELNSSLYDQFEVFNEGKRVKRGRKLPLDLRKIRKRVQVSFNPDLFPKQIVNLNSANYFLGDRLHRALQNSPAIQNWRALELNLGKTTQKKNFLADWLNRHLLLPYKTFLEGVIRRAR